MMKIKKIRVVIADDHPLFREGIRSVLSREDHFEVLAEASDGEECVRLVKNFSPDLVLMDISMPKMNGLEAAQVLKKVAPDVKVLAMSVHNNKEYIHRMVDAGVQGYVVKDSPAEELVSAIEAVNRGEAYFSQNLSQMILKEFVGNNGRKKQKRSELSKREGQVLGLIAEGLGNKEIAHRLFVSIRTIETHRERIMKKLDIHSIAGLTKFALSNGFTRLE
jgi:two-component system, NarL family, nitrate/nitrite response regulator NarL